MTKVSELFSEIICCNTYYVRVILTKQSMSAHDPNATTQFFALAFGASAKFGFNNSNSLWTPIYHWKWYLIQ
jgi:hypothetical protein